RLAIFCRAGVVNSGFAGAALRQLATIVHKGQSLCAFLEFLVGCGASRSHRSSSFQFAFCNLKFRPRVALPLGGTRAPRLTLLVIHFTTAPPVAVIPTRCRPARPPAPSSVACSKEPPIT